VEYPQDQLGYESTGEAIAHGARDAAHDVVRFTLIGVVAVSAAWILMGKEARKVVKRWTS